jgi:hypothetical protein
MLLQTSTCQRGQQGHYMPWKSRFRQQTRPVLCTAEAANLQCEAAGPLAAPKFLDHQAQHQGSQRAAALKVKLVKEVLHCECCNVKKQCSHPLHISCTYIDLKQQQAGTLVLVQHQRTCARHPT